MAIKPKGANKPDKMAGRGAMKMPWWRLPKGKAIARGLASQRSSPMTYDLICLWTNKK